MSLRLLVCLVVLLAGSSTAAAETTPGEAHLRPDGHVSLAWFYGGSSDEYRAQVERTVGLSVASPTWWYLDRDDPGAIDSTADPDLIAWLHDRGIAVWPLLGNRIDPDLTDLVLRDPALRARLVDSVAEAARTTGVDGVNVDFENLHDPTAPLLTDFVAELKAALPDLVISVDVTAMTDTWVLGNWSTAFDRAGLGQVADYVALMAYDQHNRLRPGGPVAGLDWVKESVEFLLRDVPADRVLLGVPLYARDWIIDPAGGEATLDATLGMAAMARRVAERSEIASFDAAAGMPLHAYVDGQGRHHRVWLEDPASLARKAALVDAYGLAGVAAWRAGFEEPSAWDALDAALAGAGPPGPRTAVGADAAAPDDADAADGVAQAAAAPLLPEADGPPAPAAAGSPAPERNTRLLLGSAALLVALAAAHLLTSRRRARATRLPAPD